MVARGAGAAGSCDWLIASGTRTGWRRGWLAAVSELGAVRHYWLGGCSALLVYLRRSRQVRRAGPVLLHVSPPRCWPSLASLAVLGSGCPVRVPLGLACWYAIPRFLYVQRAWSGCPSGARRVSVAWLCACSTCGFRVFPDPPALFWRALCNLPSQGTGRAVPTLGTRFAQVVLHRKIEVCPQMH